MGVVNITHRPLYYLEKPVPTEYESGLVPEPGWTFWGKECLPPQQLRTSDLPA
jgi:hypothetical protein